MKKVLLVEDSPDVSLAISMALTKMGFDVRCVSDAISVVSQVRQFLPDIVLLDINLPGGDGFLVAKRLQSIAHSAGIPFIFITASKQQGLREKAMEIGAHAFLEKPFGIRELVDAIESAFVDVEDDLSNLQIG